MKRFFLLVMFFISLASIAQEEVIQSVYFEFNKSILDQKQALEVLNFIKNIDSSRIENIHLYGYCDDRGKDAYNFKLSTNRANVIQQHLIDNGIKSKIIVSIEGKGRVMIDDDVLENIPDIRSKNRRVDVVMNLKPLPKIEIPGVYKELQKKHAVGDRIYLENILFERGSSKINAKSHNELEKVAKQLLKYKNVSIEIQGHVCCTPPFQKEAIDRDTRKRELSKNRAEIVYKYFLYRKIDASRLTFKGYGNSQPLGREPQYDRRVELIITKI
jgi:outer membrane protein OmpA-like peptidoglycan-associated protein